MVLIMARRIQSESANARAYLDAPAVRKQCRPPVSTSPGNPAPRKNGRRKRQAPFTRFVLTIKRKVLDEMTVAGARVANITVFRHRKDRPTVRRQRHPRQHRRLPADRLFPDYLPIRQVHSPIPARYATGQYSFPSSP